MNRVRMVIEGIGAVGGFGEGMTALQQAFSGLLVNQDKVSIETREGTKEIPAYLAGTDGLFRFFEKKELRRIDHYSRLALLGACLALEDASRPVHNVGPLGVIIATGYGPHRTTFSFLDSFIEGGDVFSSPTQFASSVHNAAAAYIGILLHQTGPSLTVSQFETSVASGLLTAWSWLEEQRVEAVLLGAVDEYSPVLGYCWERLLGPLPGADVRINPGNFDVQTAIPGEGAAFFVLSCDETRKKRGVVTGVTASSCHSNEVSIAADNKILIGADGQRNTGRYYKTLPFAETALCYSHAYGSVPVGQAFDLAIATLVMSGVCDEQELEATSCKSRAISCVKFGSAGQSGIVQIDNN